MSRGPQQASAPDRKVQEQLRSTGGIPRHVAVIMDGNGRWAKAKGMPRVAGHAEGVESVRDIVEACGELGVEFLTLYAFSTENWKRPKEEGSTLMRLLLKALRDETDRLHTHNVRLLTIGELDVLPDEVRKELLESIAKTSGNTGLSLILALSYSGRWDIARAVRTVAEHVAAGRLRPGEITEATIQGMLSTQGVPDPDLMIRTSGEFRISNFLLWQLAYTEIHITSKLWPAFRRGDLYEAIRDFQRRERRYGMVSEQIADHRNGEDHPNEELTSVTGP